MRENSVLSEAGKKVMLELLCQAVMGRSFREFKSKNPQWRLLLGSAIDALFRRNVGSTWLSQTTRQMQAAGWDFDSDRLKSLIKDGVDEGLGESFLLSRDFLYRFYRRVGVPGALRDVARDATDNQIHAAVIARFESEGIDPFSDEFDLAHICAYTLEAAKEFVLVTLLAEPGGAE